ncbi:Uncharacterized protein possibly involved in utilization of glycolate and propanediol [Rubrobacter radiotolerans]|uniref:Heme-binding protein n=1 Tax=Rubrobacter radiotolerans TaxID=42256 RepID=A0A023X530_RUBRA|nr:heme-binding protein [Rubrobacter radiotolerans]AHY47174.1 Uncharacterized protein possibly involved in utilization of glycolate and propanediol [Rubrobacter radiotolerans]MDX5894579.1 heme-binding protein [Rubrobacter radiotolerans]SMC06301.1 Uncharacterized conserved protein GlcG, DUF336 family [Rubrobacter radiotolerans DSM 5868]
MESISLEDARRVIAAAEKKAEEIDCPMDIAVVDAGGNLKAFARMDESFVGSIGISIDKAWTSIAFKCRTADLAPLTQSGESIFGLNTTNSGRVIIFGGGVPLVRDGNIVGAVGVSTGTVDQDMEVAEAGAAAFGQ